MRKLSIDTSTNFNKRTNSVIVNGGKKLKGTVGVQGSKNATLPILASAVLFNKKVKLRNVPDIADVHSMLEILEYLGASCSFENNVVYLDGSQIQNKTITDDLSSKLRASSLLLGPLLARFGFCEVGMPGGCSIGPRPLNFHFDGFEHLGSSVSVEEGIVKATANSIKGDFTLEFPSVGATQNLINSAIFANGSVILRNIAIEPEVMAMIEFLNGAGAKIKVFEQNSVEIIGIKELVQTEYQIPFDRIEAGTIACAALATKGDVLIKGVNPNDMAIVLQKLADMGAKIEIKENSVRVKYVGNLIGTNIRTGVHPAFPTDMQSQFSVLMTRAESMSVITETIFNNRFRHLDELMKLSGDITIEKNTAVINPSQLSACRVHGYDLRGSASMVIAGLVAKGATRVDGLEYMYRGYENFIEKLIHLGAEVYYFDKESLI